MRHSSHLFVEAASLGLGALSVPILSRLLKGEVLELLQLQSFLPCTGYHMWREAGQLCHMDPKALIAHA